MKKLFVKPINYLVELNQPITEICFDDPFIYRNISFDFLDYVIYSIDNNEKDLLKEMLRITDLFHLELNNKKILNALYKQLSNELTEEEKNELSEIESKILNLLDSIVSHSNYSIVYTDEINLSGLFSLFQLSLKEVEHEKYLENFMSFVKVNIFFNHYSLIVTNELTNILNKDEVKLLTQELSLLGVHLIDLKLNNNQKISKNYTIDNEWCVI